MLAGRMQCTCCIEYQRKQARESLQHAITHHNAPSHSKACTHQTLPNKQTNKQTRKGKGKKEEKEEEEEEEDMDSGFSCTPCIYQWS